VEYKDYYKIMGVARNASQDEIKRAYKKLARKYHPDVSSEADAEARFKEMGEAYEVLKDPEKRAAYDQFGENWKAGQDFKPPPNWDAGFEFKDGYAGGDPSAHSDFFESLFGHGFGSARGRGTNSHPGFQAQGQNHHAKVLIDIEDAYRGVKQTITLQSPELDDSGHVRLKQHSLNVKIPRGVKQGQKIRLGGQGSPGIGGGPAGDLYLEIEFKQHSVYRAEGGDLYLDLPVTPWEAALGAKVKVPTPDGVVELQIPANSLSEGKLRLKGRGIPGKPPGNIYVRTKIVLPEAKSNSDKELYQKMQETMAFNPRSKLGV
jgi:curved DNA-binding protein